MSELEVRIVRLEPMRVASVHAFGASPETAAWDKLVAWAEPKELLHNLTIHRIFGFNNPSPSAGSSNYGYEFWIQVGPEIVAGGDAKIKEFSGGLYAVTRCKGVENITPTWKQLVAWCEDSPYKFAHHQWLEEHIGSVGETPEELTLDLYLPIAQ